MINLETVSIPQMFKASASAMVLVSCAAIVIPAFASSSSSGNNNKPDPWHPNHYVCPNCRRVYDNKGDADKCCN